MRPLLSLRNGSALPEVTSWKTWFFRYHNGTNVWLTPLLTMIIISVTFWFQGTLELAFSLHRLDSFLLWELEFLLTSHIQGQIQSGICCPLNSLLIVKHHENTKNKTEKTVGSQSLITNQWFLWRTCFTQSVTLISFTEYTGCPV